MTADGAVSRRRLLVLTLAGVTAATEAASVAGLIPKLHVGDLLISASLIPALVLAIACGARLFGRSWSRRAATWYWAAAVVLIPLLGVGYWRSGHLGWYPGLVASAFTEELVYRLAVPAVIGASLRLGKVRPPASHIAGLVGAGLWFVLLPGHREQMTSPAAAIPFVAFAALSALLVYRSGSVLPMALAHAITNLFTVLMWQDEVVSSLRSAAVGSVLLLLMVAYGRSSRITIGDDGRLVDTRTGMEVAVIDLRDGRPATVELVDGTVVTVDGWVTVNGPHARSATDASADTDATSGVDHDETSPTPTPTIDDHPVPADLRDVSDASRARAWQRRQLEELGHLPRTVLADQRAGAAPDGAVPHAAGTHPVDDMVSGVGLHHRVDGGAGPSQIDRIGRALGLDDEPTIGLI